MIKTKKEYQQALKDLAKSTDLIDKQKKWLEGLPLTAEEVQRGLEPLNCYHSGLKEEVKYYEQALTGNFEPVINLTQLGKLLICLRLYKKMSQKELADKIGVKKTQVSRDEKNEYFGASLEKVQRVLSALDVQIKLDINFQ